MHRYDFDMLCFYCKINCTRFFVSIKTELETHNQFIRTDMLHGLALADCELNIANKVILHLPADIRQENPRGESHDQQKDCTSHHGKGFPDLAGNAARQ